MAERPFAEVLGDPVAHSLSPVLHGFWLRACGIEGDFVATRVPELELAAHLAARRANPQWRGASVTVPLKERAVALVDRLEPMAGLIGAVNCVFPRAGELVGANTDWSGFMGPLGRLWPPDDSRRHAVILGAGGAARAIAHGLVQAGWTLSIVNRSLDRAHGLARELGRRAERASDDVRALPWPASGRIDWSALAPEADRTLLVHATSLGMEGEPPLELTLGALPPGLVVVDIVYRPLETAILVEARQRGLMAIDGLDMLIGQAAGGFERFFGRVAPRERDGELRALLAGRAAG